MKFWLGLAGCLALGMLGAMLTIEGSPPPAEPAQAARPPAAPAWTDISDADRAGVPRQMQARVILARQAGEPTRPAAEPARPMGEQAGDPASPPADQARTTPKAPEPARATADTQALDEVRRRAEGRVRQAEAEADTARRRLEQEEARANALSDAAMTARRDLIAARAEVEELRARAAHAPEADGTTAQARAAAEEARRAAEEVADERRQALAEERTRSEQLAAALAEARRRVAVLETAAEAAQVAHQAQAQAASRERAMMRAGLRRLAVALRAAQVAQSEAVAREAQTAGARDRAEQGRLAAERVAAETRGRLDRLKAGRDRADEASLPVSRPAKARQPALALQARPGPAPAVPPSTALVPASAGAAETLDEERLLARVAILLGRGDISGARLFLTLGVRSGSARATALLAETYDPDKLAALQVRGLRGDPEKASALYRQAQAGKGPVNQGPDSQELANRDPAETPPAGPAHRGQPGWIDPIRQAGLPAPFVPSLAAPWGGE